MEEFLERAPTDLFRLLLYIPLASVLTMNRSTYPPCHTRLIFGTRLLFGIILEPHDDEPDPKTPRRAASKYTWTRARSGHFAIHL